ncbi:MAG: DnaJ family domain-containing protein [Pseudomonadota bacterium]
MIFSQKIIENIINKAIERGEFDNLPGYGKPLVLEDDSHIPPDLRMAYKILKNADCIPPELQLKKDIQNIQDMLGGMTDEKERYRQIKKLNFLVLKLNMMRRSQVDLEENQVYYDKVVEKVK